MRAQTAQSSHPRLMPMNVSAWASLKLLFIFFPIALHSQNASANCWNGTALQQFDLNINSDNKLGDMEPFKIKFTISWMTHISKQSKPKNSESIPPSPSVLIWDPFFKQFYSKVRIKWMTNSNSLLSGRAHAGLTQTRRNQVSCCFQSTKSLESSDTPRYCGTTQAAPPQQLDSSAPKNTTNQTKLVFSGTLLTQVQDQNIPGSEDRDVSASKIGS